MLAFVYLGAWTVVAVDPRFFSPLSIAAGSVLLAIWATFIVDYVVRFVLAADRAHFFGRSIPDLVAAILPQLRPVVQLRHLTTIPFFARRSGPEQRARVAVLAIAFAVIFIYSIALSVLVVERPAPGAVILTLGDAVWWACVTLFTVGYGDLYPVTPAGRAWAVALMIGGVGIIGAASAIFVSYLNERIRQHADPHEPGVAAPELRVDDEIDEELPADADGAAPGEGTAPSGRASD